MSSAVRVRASRTIVAAVLAATAAAVLPATARSALVCTKSGATILANSQARVFRSGKVASGETKGAPLYYGCSRATGHIKRLNPSGEFGIERVTASTIRLAGNYVGYVETRTAALGTVPVAPVVDTRNGKVVRKPQGSDQEGFAFTILGLVVTQRGTEAWIAQDCVRSATQPTVCAQPMATEYRVVISDSTTGMGQLGERVISHSPAIAQHSLALALNSHAIYWTEAGAARTAPIH